jgi:hypothetical protein
VFAVEERDRVREGLVELARTDDDVIGAAYVGSYAADGGDRWSDIDLTVGVKGDLGPVIERWTGWLYKDFGAVHHWDLPAGAAVFRVFLLPRLLEVDIGFRPAADFGPRGPNWRTIFGEAGEARYASPPELDQVVGFAWHHLIHARVCIERKRPWQAEYWISQTREQLFALACLRLGRHTGFTKSVHLLPAEETAWLEPTLVGSLIEAELRRAWEALAHAFKVEVMRADPVVVARLRPLLSELDVGFRSC